MPRIFSGEMSSQLIDMGDTVKTGATLILDYGAGRGVHCNVSGTYRLYGVDEVTYSELYLVAGGCYPYITTKITDTSGNAVVDGTVAALK